MSPVSPAYKRKAVAHLKEVDPVMARLIDTIGTCNLSLRDQGSHFDAIARSIVFQQLSGKAASTIHGRFEGLYGGRSPLPSELTVTSDERLRGAGLSRGKSAYLKDLAARVVSGELPVETLHELSDDDVIAALTRVKGIGRWTAQMFLMFRLGRPDVLPDLDLGIQKGIQKAYRLRKLPSPERVRKIGAGWAPHRTIASWYLWRLLDAPAPVPRSGD
ncbi:MAG: DNA-3-methyladenine glycosylase [Gemmatimonadota bacterium]|nr:DNA-3-methyladenine glycosylase [Gemmatimonadota bacterium]